MYCAATWLFWAVMGCAWLYWTVLGCTGCTGLYCAVLGCTGLFWTVLGCTWLHWAALDPGGPGGQGGQDDQPIRSIYDIWWIVNILLAWQGEELLIWGFRILGTEKLISITSHHWYWLNRFNEIKSWSALFGLNIHEKNKAKNFAFLYMIKVAGRISIILDREM